MAVGEPTPFGARFVVTGQAREPGNGDFQSFREAVNQPLTFEWALARAFSIKVSPEKSAALVKVPCAVQRNRETLIGLRNRRTFPRPRTTHVSSRRDARMGGDGEVKLSGPLTFFGIGIL